MTEVKRIVLIVPGRRERVDSQAYRSIGSLFERKSIKPEYIQPNWKLRSIPELLKDTSMKIDKSIQKNDYDEVYACGFSLGAMFSLMNASRIEIKTSILCSMSFFREEVPYMGRVLKFFTEKLIYGGTEPFSYPDVYPQQRFILIYGEKELKSIPKEVIESRKDMFGTGLPIIAKGAGHNIGHAGYQSAIKSAIEEIW